MEMDEFEYWILMDSLVGGLFVMWIGGLGGFA